MLTLYLLKTTYIDTLWDAVVIDASDMESAQRLAKEYLSEDIIRDARRRTNDRGNQELDRVDPNKLLWAEHDFEGWELNDPEGILASLGWEFHLGVAKIIRAT